MKRSWHVLGGLVVLQGLAALVYWRVEGGRTTPAAVRSKLREAPERIDHAFPKLAVMGPQGRRFPLPAPTRPTLVHLWATWCPPCKEELPGLLQLSAEGSVQVWAIALDRDWSEVRRLLGEPVPSAVVLAESAEVERELRVRNLPTTFVAGGDGRLRWVFHGERDWTQAELVERWLVNQ